MSTAYVLIPIDEYNQIEELEEENEELADKLTESYEYAKWLEKQITMLKLELAKQDEKAFKEIDKLNRSKNGE